MKNRIMKNEMNLTDRFFRLPPKTNQAPRQSGNPCRSSLCELHQQCRANRWCIIQSSLFLNGFLKKSETHRKKKKETEDWRMKVKSTLAMQIVCAPLDGAPTKRVEK